MPWAYLEARTMGFCIRRFKNSDQHAWNVGTSASFVVKESQRFLIYTHFLKFCSLLKQQSHFLFLLSNVKKKKMCCSGFQLSFKNGNPVPIHAERGGERAQGLQQGVSRLRPSCRQRILKTSKGWEKIEPRGIVSNQSLPWESTSADYSSPGSPPVL